MLFVVKSAAKNIKFIQNVIYSKHWHLINLQYTPFEAANYTALPTLTRSPVSFYFWHVVCKNNLDNRGQSIVAKFTPRCFFALQHSHITHPKSQYMQLFCKLVRIYKTRIGNKTKSVFSCLRFDFKAQKSYKNTSL